MATIATMVLKMQSDTAELVKGAERAQGTLTKIERGAGMVGKALAGAFAVTAIVAAGKKIIDFASDITDLSQKTHISTTGLQKWALAFEQSGVSIETVAKAATELGARLVGDKGAVSLVGKLGLHIDQLRRMNPEDQFTAVADAVGNIQNQGEKLFASKTLFGRGGVELLSALDGHLKQTTDGFEAMGLILDEQTIKAADDFGDKLGLLGKQGLALIASVLTPLLPLLSFVADSLMHAGQVIAKVLGPAIDWITRGLLAASIQMQRFVATILEAATHVPLLGKHLGIAGDAANWLREQAARNEQTLVKMFTATTNVGTSAAQAAPKLLGLGEATAKATEASERFMTAQERILNLSRNSAGAAFAQGMALYRAELEKTTIEAERMVGAMSSISGPNPIVDNKASSPGQAAGLWSRMFGGKEGLIGGLNSIFQSAFTGGGGAIGAIKSFATTALSTGLSFIPGIGPLLSKLAGPIVAGFSKLFGGLFGGGEKSKVKEMLGQFAQGFGGMDALRAAAEAAGVSLDKLFSTKKIRDFETEATRVTGAMRAFAEAQAADTQRLTEAVQRYGFSFEELGPKLQQQHLHDQAQELINDWRVLVGAGIDVVTVNEKMADSINEFVHMARRTGLEVPEAFRQILQSMIDQGSLLDENGVAFTDLESVGLHFSRNVTEAINGLIEKIGALIDKLNAVPRDLTIGVNYVEHNIPPPPNSGVDQLAAGGIVMRPTLAMVGERGPEAVVPLGSGGTWDLSGLRADVQMLGAKLDAIPLATRDAVLLAAR